MDTTAKVDIRKLQLLNDRIAQTIEALNQVRMSVHGLGLSHTQSNLQGMQGIGQGIGVGGGAFGGMGMPFSQVQGWPGVMQGLSHTTPFGYPQQYGQQQYGQPFGGQPFGQQVNPLVAQLYGQQLGGGLSHTSPEGYGVGGQMQGVGIGGQQWPGVGIDPFTAARLMQMFPYAQMPISPVG